MKQDKCKILWKMIPVIANKIIVFCVASLQRPSRPLALVYTSVWALSAHLIQISISLSNAWLLAFSPLLCPPPLEKFTKKCPWHFHLILSRPAVLSPQQISQHIPLLDLALFLFFWLCRVLEHVGSSSWDLTQVPCIGSSQSLHWTTRKSQTWHF